MNDKEYNLHFPAGIPCKVEKSDISDIDEEIMLISANHDVRESSMEVKRWEVSRLKELYEAKKLTGEIKNINAEIAKQLNISERQARKYPYHCCPRCLRYYPDIRLMTTMLCSSLFLSHHIARKPHTTMHCVDTTGLWGK